VPNEGGPNPAAGIRVNFELLSGDDTSARYAFTLFVHDARFDCVMTLAKGAATCDAWRGGEPDAAHADAACAIGKTIAKSALADSPVVWPRKITRWRDK
jgi:hypothetical protein